MGTYQDDRAGAAPGAPDYPQPEAVPARPPQGSRGKITTRPSRESILQSYASQDEMRARNAACPIAHPEKAEEGEAK
ncbi:hypothetical protein NSA09_08660 [Adlercreutzia mucosicola]|uniref:hypothetical protein n=1 Tax=Adlercreutzia mucosicola TaxID=580026 RepID=UPI00214B635D|nr:hypothetical protein [Adlercreutzia mucosicola]MCR2035582.1 hypothetical protein [Adlercreutzia mucosicola]